METQHFWWVFINYSHVQYFFFVFCMFTRGHHNLGLPSESQNPQACSKRSSKRRHRTKPVALPRCAVWKLEDVHGRFKRWKQNFHLHVKYFKPRSQKIFQGLHHFHVSHGSIWSIWKLLQLKDALIARCMVCNFIKQIVLIFSGKWKLQWGSPFPVRLWNKLWGFEG